jgi:hypothetical protein
MNAVDSPPGLAAPEPSIGSESSIPPDLPVPDGASATLTAPSLAQRAEAGQPTTTASEVPTSNPNYRKIAKLPKPLRDRINSMLDDGLSAREIIHSLEQSTDPPLPYALSEMCISRWKDSGYHRYLAQQERLTMVQSNREGAGDLIATDDLTTLPEATLQIVANQYYEFLTDFSPETLKQKLSDDPLKYTRFLNVFARLVREIVHLRKFRDASAKAAAIQLKKLDPDRDLSDNEYDLLLNNMDRVFKVARRKKPNQSPNPDRSRRGDEADAVSSSQGSSHADSVTNGGGGVDSATNKGGDVDSVGGLP